RQPQFFTGGDGAAFSAGYYDDYDEDEDEEWLEEEEEDEEWLEEEEEEEKESISRDEVETRIIPVIENYSGLPSVYWGSRSLENIAGSRDRFADIIAWIEHEFNIDIFHVIDGNDTFDDLVNVIVERL